MSSASTAPLGIELQRVQTTRHSAGQIATASVDMAF